MKTANYNYQQDLSKVILWQYDDAEKFKSLVANEEMFMDNAVTSFWEDFDKNIFKLSTCNTFGLELWGKLLNVARPTYNDGGVIREFNDEQYRLLLQSRIYVLTFDGSTKSLNYFMKMMLPDYNVMIKDNYDMTVDIYFATEPSADIKAVLRDDTFLPRPSGVEYILHWAIDYSKIFAFEGMEYQDKQMPAFTDSDAANYDPTTDGGGVFNK